MIQYGLISETDARTLEKTIDLICDEFKTGGIHICEVGIYGGDTGKGLTEYVIKSKKRPTFITGIDNNKDGEILRFGYSNLIVGNSNEVYNKLEGNSQHLILIDALHTFPAVIADFFCYAPKIKKGGYLSFHDTGKHIKPMTGYQGVGSKEDADMYISVRKALYELQLMGDSYVSKQFMGWELIFDEADETNPMGGICVFKKL